MKLKKRHKMYIRSKDGSLRNLAKLNSKLYDFIQNQFDKGTARRDYQTKNYNVKSWEDYLPIDLKLDKELSKELEKITSKEDLVVFYNGSWQPLVKLIKETNG